jgi:hypothetical protein
MIRIVFYKESYMKKELTIFITLFLFLAIGMHFKEWVSHPIDHIMALTTAGAYGIGPFHPLIFTTALYLVIAFFRGIGSVFAKK